MLRVFLVAILASIASGTGTDSNILMAAPQEGPRRLVTNLRGFGIPFQINANDDTFIEVHLYLSRDGGRNWSFQGRQTTDQQECPFHATADGDYWFALKTLDRDRRLLPEGQTRPELHVVVDTARPQLDFRVQTDPAGRVVCRWQAQDPNPPPIQPATVWIGCGCR